MSYPHRVAVQEKGEATYPDPATWSTLRSQWCYIGRPLGNKSVAELSAAGAEITREILFREKPRVKIDQRLLWGLHSFFIEAVATGDKEFTIDGEFGDDFNQGDLIEVSGSTGNDGIYTVAGVAESSGDTVVTVSEAVPDATADGKIRILKIFTVRGVARDASGKQRVRVKEDQ